MSYRVELAVTGRAGCNNKECKDAGIKIQKDELRLGTWVDIHDHGSWQWKHWGCVTGKQLQNLRKYLEDERKPGSGDYLWDKMDGYNDGGKGSLDNHPELQEKVRRVVTQGYIDSEDWKGDPEMNALGQTGTRTTESKKKIKNQKSAEMGNLTELQAKWDEAEREKQVLIDDGKGNGLKVKALNKNIAHFSKEMAARRKEEEKQKADMEMGAIKAEKANTPQKRSRVKKEDADEEEEDENPAKKKRGGKVKKEEDSDEEVMPVKKARGRKAVVKKEEDLEEEVMPAKKARGRKAVVKEEDDEEEMKPAPAKKSRAKKSTTKKEVKEAEDDEDEEQIEEEEERVKPAPAKKPRVTKSAIKKEVKGEEDDEDEILTKSAPAPKKGRKNSKKVKEEEAEAEAESEADTPDLVSDNDTSRDELVDEEIKVEEDEEEIKPAKKGRGRPSKKRRA
ncbi:hypothetical protein SBOR_9148 [Sclerotinia borealis F-4128]|uniref:PARP-type domain-containing protein n=1 Tax=Sclerotinia borealis (strain F-4128) TaxID=1432307 RepID=W9C6C7_SCLBF|nr:hypothetical protein SBOR_9148 [Sclerotinia borealis F-4128]